MPTLRISTDKVCYVVVKARQFDVKVAPEWLNGGSNPTDDGMTRVLEDYKDDPTLAELHSYLRAMNQDLGVGLRAADRIADDPLTADLGADLRTFYADVMRRAEEALGLSIQEGAAYRAAASDLASR